MGERHLDFGGDFHREVHAALDARFRADLAVQHMMKELDVPGPLARCLVLREPLPLTRPDILVPYVRLSLPDGVLSSLRTIDYAGHNRTQPVVRMSLNSRDITTIMHPDTQVDLSADSDPLEVAELYMDLCRPREEEDPRAQNLVVLTRHRAGNGRSVVRCRRLRSEDTVPYRPLNVGPLSELGQGRLENFVPDKTV